MHLHLKISQIYTLKLIMHAFKHFKYILRIFFLILHKKAELKKKKLVIIIIIWDVY